MNKLTIILLAAGLAATGTSTLAAQRIGVASTVNNTVTGTVGGRTNALRAGDAVFHREVISSETGAEAQLMFVDETVFNVGSGATVTLDEFIYNPNQKAGNIVLNVTKGAFRFISGSAQPSSYTIKTPVATIGVRGTIFTGNILSELFMTLKLLKGQLLICLKQGAKIEGSGINFDQPAERRHGEDCYLVDPGTFNVGFGPLDDPETPPGDDSDPNDGDDDPVDDNPGTGSVPFIEEGSNETGGFSQNLNAVQDSAGGPTQVIRLLP